MALSEQGYDRVINPVDLVEQLAAAHDWACLLYTSCGTIRLKLLKIGALVTTSVRRVKLAFASACPEREVFELVARRL